MSVTAAPRPSSAERDLDAIIVGAGFGGIAAAIELRRHGICDVRILEKGPSLGGTWWYNSYPGAACDVPSHLYSFSYAQRRDWSRLCSPQEEILAYLREVARTYDVDGLVTTGAEVRACRWDEQSCRWHVTCADGAEHSARALIFATGQLHRPARPRVEGIERFAGHSFHSAEWDHGYELDGKRVAVIGTGASAVQFVPEIAPRVAQLKVFQRSGNWFLPRRNRAYPMLVKRAIAGVPGVQAFRRGFMFEYCESLTLSIRHPDSFGRMLAARSATFMRSQLKDAQLRAKAWPDYTFGCKRVLFSSYYLPALERENVDLVVDPVCTGAPEGLLTADGQLHEFDCIIWATGFRTTHFMEGIEVSGAGGAELHERWSDGAHAHLGMTVPSFPNMFILYGPNTNTSGGSIIYYLEQQSAYVRQALQELRRRGAGAIEVRADVEAASDRDVQARFAGTAWTRCDSWYRDEHGRVIANWPGYMREYRKRTRTLDPGEFEFVPAPALVTARSAQNDNGAAAG